MVENNNRFFFVKTLRKPLPHPPPRIVVKAISGTQTVRFKNELERNITIKLGYANAKIFKIDLNTVPEEKKSQYSNMDLHKEYYCSNGSGKADRFKVETETAKEIFGESAEYECIRHVSFVDCPGHDILMATMLTGAAIMDAALLLIAADQECPQPQTNEHLAAIEIMGLRHIVILQNKIDLVTKEDASKQVEAINNFKAGTSAKNAPVIPISAQLKLNVDVLCQYMARNVPVPNRDFTKNPKLSVIRSFDINKPGCEIENLKGGIAGGSILHGVFKLGDEIEIRPGLSFKDKDTQQWKARPLTTKIVSLSSESNPLQYAVPGGLIGIGTNLDPCLCRGDNLVGNIIGLPGTLPNVYDMIEISFHLMSRIAGAQATSSNKQDASKKKKASKIGELEKKETIQINIGSCCTTAQIKKVQDDICQLQLNQPICTDVGEKVALSRRIDRHWRLIGWGTIEKGHDVQFSE